MEFYDPLDNKERKEEEFVFNTAFAGWASSALTVSLGETDDDDALEVKEESVSSSVFTVVKPEKLIYGPGRIVEMQYLVTKMRQLLLRVQLVLPGLSKVREMLN